jgi:hypothetical protein
MSCSTVGRFEICGDAPRTIQFRQNVEQTLIVVSDHEAPFLGTPSYNDFLLTIFGCNIEKCLGKYCRRFIRRTPIKML